MKAFLSPPRKFCRFAMVLLVAALLAACGGGNGSDFNAAGDSAALTHDGSLASFAQQQLHWQLCASSVTDGQQEMAEQRAMASLGDRVRCARLRVPLDYDRPAAGELQIELMRVAAAQPRHRLGAIVLNPGGPGMSGLAMGLSTELKFRRAQDMRVREMGRRYDLIGFSPRGTGASNPLICHLREPLDAKDNLAFNHTIENLRAAEHNAWLVADACLSNPLSRHIHTDATARDMELMRAVLGEARLNYIGYSYGSWLGAWYARLFPERVGRMLLDGNTDIGNPLAWQAQPATARQRILDQIMLPYAQRHPQELALGSADTLRAALLALAPPLQRALFNRIDFRSSSLLDIGVLWMSAAIGLGSVMQAHPGVDAQALKALIERHAFVPSEPLNEIAALLAGNLLAALDKGTGSAGGVNDTANDITTLTQAVSVNMSVRCNDTGRLRDARYWRELSDDDARRHPLLAGTAAVGNICLHWSTPSRGFPAATAADSAPLLMLQSRFDGITPVEQALATLAALPQARMIVVEDEYQHGLFPYGTGCVDRQVADYFLQGMLPQRLSSCAGKQQPLLSALRQHGG